MKKKIYYKKILPKTENKKYFEYNTIYSRLTKTNLPVKLIKFV
jgi:hypothetical protein